MSVVTLPFHPDDSAFNRINAIYLAHASSIAYERAPVKLAQGLLGLDSFTFFHKLTRTRGFLGICDTHAVLAFRGTNPLTLPNWMTDVVVKLVESDHHHGRVHRGFNSALRQTWSKLEACLAHVQDRPLFLTGHSMGGALAVLAACRLAKDGITPTATYTFGAPRVGDRSFCAGYTLPTYRVVNRLDLVPEMPFASIKRLLPSRPRLTNNKFLGKLKQAAGKLRCYGHVKTFVYIDGNGTITPNADIDPRYAKAVAQVISSRGKSVFAGVNDHLISNYIRGLEGEVVAPVARVRRRR